MKGVKNGTRTVVLYARVSTELQEHPDLQIDELRRVAEARGWRIIAEFIERASGANRKRPRLAEAMALIREGKARVLAAVSLDRISRSLQHLLTICDEIEAFGGHLVSTRDGELDTTTPSGKAFIHLRGVFAEFERNLASERARECARSLKARGMSAGGPKLTVTPFAARMAAELRFAGASWREVLARLEMEGHGTISRPTIQRHTRSILEGLKAAQNPPEKPAA